MWNGGDVGKEKTFIPIPGTSLVPDGAALILGTQKSSDASLLLPESLHVKKNDVFVSIIADKKDVKSISLSEVVVNVLLLAT